jgi:hypothetical protein
MSAQPDSQAPVLEVKRRTRRDRRSEVRPDCYRQAWVTVAEAAQISGLSIDRIRDLCQVGRIHSRPLGAYRVDQQSLQAYLRGETVRS